jgi:hypothetical protein
MANSIGSLRLLAATDWREFVEDLSVVERALRADPAYGAMDFATRDHYRHVIERLAKASPLDEGEMARHAISLAKARDAHVGFYLIDEGLPELERVTRVRLALPEALRRTGRRHALALYLGAIALATGMLTAWLLTDAYAHGTREWMLVLAGLVATLATSQLAVALVNRLASALAAPQPLPRMDFSKGIPPPSRTLVVVPAMLSGAAQIERLVEALEVRFLANRDENLHYALLTDFRDADQETMPEDEALAAAARDAIDALNRKYRSAERFFLFHRPRRWNPGERCWMGYERKRGKLDELNSCLRGAPTDRFSIIVGESAVLQTVKYVITLDVDTQLPRDAARRLAGAMAHPLNRPRYDQRRGRVCEGYGILQPRMAVSISSGSPSRYAQIFGAEAGIDPYTRAVSDVYQDLFGEGSFIGKGIYDVDAFEGSLKGRFPENRILSHDLLEGCYARSGLLSDVELYEEHPSRYSADVARRHRWIRGDWQIARWLLPRVPVEDGGRHQNPLSLLSQWKIFDNLRRSLVPLALVGLLFAGWSLTVLAIVLAPALLASLLELLQKPLEVPLRRHLAPALRACARQADRHCSRSPAFPTRRSSAWTRSFARRRGCCHADSAVGMDPSGEADDASYKSMWIGPSWPWPRHFGSPPPARRARLAAPILLLWFASPALAWWISLPLARSRRGSPRSRRVSWA